MTATEVMAAGTPVVATTVGGISTLVDECEQGYLAMSNDHTVLAEQVKRLLSHSDANLDQMGQKAQEQAHEYSWSGIAEQFVSVYDKVSR